MGTRTFSAAALMLALAGVPANGQTPPRFTVEDMLAMRSLAGGQPVAVSFTGRWVAYALTDMDDEWNVQEGRPTGYISVQTLGTSAGAPRALTSGAAHSSFPVWSPDGALIVYTGPVVGPVGSLVTVHADGTPGDALNIQVRVGTEHYRFMPDRPQLAYIPTPDHVSSE